jgi:hypothetical protein
MLKLASQPLSNLQLELLHLYETGISDKHLLELKEVIAKFLFEKAFDQADEIWEEKGYNSDTIQDWLNKD